VAFFHALIFVFKVVAATSVLRYSHLNAALCCPDKLAI